MFSIEGLDYFSSPWNHSNTLTLFSVAEADEYFSIFGTKCLRKKGILTFEVITCR